MTLENIIRKAKKAALLGVGVAVLTLASCKPVVDVIPPVPLNFDYSVSSHSVDHYHEEPGSDSPINDVFISNNSTGGEGLDYISVSLDDQTHDLYNGETAKFDIQKDGNNGMTIEKYVNGSLVDTFTEDVEGRDTAPNAPRIVGGNHEIYWVESIEQYVIPIPHTASVNHPISYDLVPSNDINNDETQLIAPVGLPPGAKLENNSIECLFTKEQVGEPVPIFVKSKTENGTLSEYTAFNFIVEDW